MPMKFSKFPDLPGQVQTVLSDDDGDDPSEGGTIGSASAFEGDLKDLPEFLLFGEAECRVKYEAASDKGLFVRVCGRNRDLCTRTGHLHVGEMDRALEGYYEAVRSRSYVDGKHHTYRTVEDYQKSEKERKEQQKQEMYEATRVLSGLDQDSPTASEKFGYEEAQGLPKSTPHGAKPEVVVSETKPRVQRSQGDSGPLKEGGSLSHHQGDLRTSPVLKKVKEAGKLDEAMIGMMEYLAKSVNKLEDRLGNLETEPERKTSGKDGRKEESQMSGAQERHLGPWYAVAKGQGGIQGVYTSWSVASPLVVGVSGAIYQKFKTKEAAERFVQGYSEGPEVGRNETTERNTGSKETQDQPVTGLSGPWYTVINEVTKATGMYPSWERAEPNVNGVRGARVRKFPNFEAAHGFMETWTSKQKGAEDIGGKSTDLFPKAEYDQRTEVEPKNAWDQDHYYPPSDVMGPDPSVTKDDQVFGVDLGGSEADLRNALCPPGLSGEEARSLTNALVDVVALPGGYLGGSGGDEGGVNDMALLGEAMEELVHQKRNGAEDGASRTDLHWRSEKRTALRNIKSIVLLRKRIKTLLKLRSKIHNRIVQATSQACRRAGWTNQTRIQAWATSGYLTRLSNDSLEYYIALHQHLMELANAEPQNWGYTKIEVDHHVEELEVIRTTADSRLQALCGLYVYLRDGNKAGWQSNSLQVKRNMDIHSKLSGGTLETDDTSALSNDGSFYSADKKGCTKCRTMLHSGGRNGCPWKNCTDESAVKKGTDALRNLANGGGLGFSKKGKGGKRGGYTPGEAASEENAL